MKKFFANFKGDKVIWAVVLILLIFSILAVYSSTGTLAYRSKKIAGNTEFFLMKHLFILVMGVALMFVFHTINYHRFSKLSQLAIFAAIVLLPITLFTGSSVNEASRWLTLPLIDLRFQTSDLAKLALIMYLARQISKRQENIKDFKKGFLPVIIPIILVCVFILPANLSTAAILFMTCVVIMIVGRVPAKYILSLFVIMLLAGGLLVLILKNSPWESRWDTWKNRIETYFGDDSKQDPADVYQVTQSKIAVASGGLFGKFPGNSTQRNMLPQAYCDFIYAIILEEYGFIGGVFILLLYMILLYRGIRIATRCDKIFGTLLGLGIIFALVFQAVINMGIVVDLLPNTGQPLPMISMGGTSIWFTSIGIGILLSISRANENAEKQKTQDQENNELTTQTADAVSE
ncbi:MAG TPA: putative peptidoglycan glycosyltransferase FtsW [Bacteroidales bacterium]|nr:putative peptidoglycan glycosyltransferase FtsW [Bacteroidales bacterium]